MTGPSVQSRATVRKALAALLKTSLGSLVQEVYAYQVATLNKQSPVVCVVSDGSERVMESPQDFVFAIIHVFVRYQDADSTPPWTEENSEDRLDAIEQGIMNLMLTHAQQREEVAPPWLSLDPVGRSEISNANFDGVDHRHEQISVVMEVANIA